MQFSMCVLLVQQAVARGLPLCVVPLHQPLKWTQLASSVLIDTCYALRQIRPF